MSKLMMVIPCNKAIGGIKTIVYSLEKELSKNNIDIVRCCSDTTAIKIFRPIKAVAILSEIIFKALTLKPKNALYFSSAGASFWEKAIWGWVLAKLNICPFMVMVDGNYPEYYNSLAISFKKLSGYLIKDVVVVAQSNSWAAFYKKIFNKNKVPIVSGGVDTDYFKPVNVVSNNKIILLYVGWMIEAKGIYDLIEATNTLYKNTSLPEFELRLVGPLYEGVKKINSMINNYKLYDIIKVIGPIYNKDKLREEYQSADIFVFPSHYEGFPVALLEALSSGLACVGSNVGGIPDILDHGDCGIVYNIKYKTQLAQSISELLKDCDKMNHLKVSSRKRAIQDYSVEKSILSYMSLFKQ